MKPVTSTHRVWAILVALLGMAALGAGPALAQQVVKPALMKSKQVKPVTKVVPDVLGKSLSEAQKILKKAGFKNVEIKGATAKEARVQAQRPKGDEKVPLNARVILKTALQKTAPATDSPGGIKREYPTDQRGSDFKARSLTVDPGATKDKLRKPARAMPKRWDPGDYSPSSSTTKRKSAKKPGEVIVVGAKPKAESDPGDQQTGKGGFVPRSKPLCPPRAPKPVLSIAYATSSVVKLWVRFSGCAGVASWQLWRTSALPPSPASGGGAATLVTPLAAEGVGPVLVADRTGRVGSHQDTGLQANQRYCYEAVGRNVFGTARSERQCVTTQPLAGPPRTPENLRIYVTADVVTLSWRDEANNETGYIIRRVFDDRPPESLGFIESDRPTRTGEQVYWRERKTTGRDSRHCYEVYAVNTSGGSIGETSACGYRPLEMPVSPVPVLTSLLPAGDLRIELNGTIGVTDYYDVHIESGDGTYRRTLRKTSYGTSKKSFTVTDLEPDTYYCVYSVAYNESAWPDNPARRRVGAPSATACTRTLPTTGGGDVRGRDLRLNITESPESFAQFNAQYDPTSATGQTSTIRAIRFLDIANPAGVKLRLLKIGKSFSDCASNDDSVVEFDVGETTTPAQMTALYGSATLSPWTFIACARLKGSAIEKGSTLQQLYINVEYAVLSP